MNNGKMLLGVLSALSIGAVLGILFAPYKGTKTRRKIAEKGRFYSDEAQGKYNELVEEIVSKFESIKHSADGLIDRGKDHLDHSQKEKI
jgi:gas vesicle protein